MTFSDRMKEILDQGVAASKDFAVKAGGKAQELGERGVLMLEIKQLESQAQKLINRLGNETYQQFGEQGKDTIYSDNPSVKGILTELALIKETMEKKDSELQTKKK
ncbi:MAG: hypothetical protein FWD78_15815 [Treponema sp.]|nr:hypothetical protein [Treponema sp.]